MSSYVVVSCTPWGRQVFDEEIARYPGAWHFLAAREEVTLERLRALDPRYVFFLHWSWKVPAEVVAQLECVCFHMTDVPYGRGGSPLQNLILRGHRATRLTALRMTPEFDAGPVYFKEELSLEGAAEEIYLRATRLAARMIRRFLDAPPAPAPQAGPVVTFKRRTPAESALPAVNGLAELYDFIRMLDATGYPPAFLDCRGFRFEFRRAALRHDRIEADVCITRRPPAAPTKDPT